MGTKYFFLILAFQIVMLLSFLWSNKAEAKQIVLLSRAVPSNTVATSPTWLFTFKLIKLSKTKNSLPQVTVSSAALQALGRPTGELVAAQIARIVSPRTRKVGEPCYRAAVLSRCCRGVSRVKRRIHRTRPPSR